MAPRLLFCCFGIVLGITQLGGCSKGRKAAALDTACVAKIKVNRDGLILLNDETVTIESLKASLSKLSQSAGSVVWYYRENATSEPHPNAMLVLEAIVEAKLPVRLSTKPDFSDSTGRDGPSDQPR